ncbi:MAG: hypothetical protein Q8R24_05255 [Legionellaceae bacterium]|nr:hypothetical protein [Legionellaceae bacterium]
MKKFWKTLAGTCIYQTPDGIKVYQNLLYRWLTLESDLLQTLINRYQPHIPSLQYINPFTFALRSSPSRCCLLGLGGGAVAHAMSASLNDIPITAVESSQTVIHTASRYFMTDKIKNLEIIHQDANIFVQTCKTNYQHLLIDIYNGDNFPTHCNHSEFFGFCNQILLPNGILSINLASIDEAWAIMQHIREHFNQKTVCMPVKGTANMVILTCKAPSVNMLLDLFNHSGELNKMVWDTQWGYVAELRPKFL